MGSYDSMKTKLEPVGLYKVADGSNISNELKAYAEGIDTLFENLDVMTRECFIDTAETYGITQREIFTGKEKDNYTIEQRREMLRLQEQNMGNKCNMEAFSDRLRSFGVYDFYFNEGFSKNVLAIFINDTLSEATKKMIEEKVEAEFPAHLVVSVNYTSET